MDGSNHRPLCTGAEIDKDGKRVSRPIPDRVMKILGTSPKRMLN